MQHINVWSQLQRLDVMCEQLFLLSYMTRMTVMWCWVQRVGESELSCCVNSWRCCCELYWQTEDRVWQRWHSKVWFTGARNGARWSYLFSVSRPSSFTGL